jgi:hypothetical protein
LGGALAVLSVTANSSKKQRDPQALTFEPGRLAQYSNMELIDLLSEKSLEQNARARGLYSLSPPDRRAKPAPGAETPSNIRLTLHPAALDYTVLVEKELVRRNAHQDLVDFFARTSDEIQQKWIMDTLSQMRGTVSDSFFRGYIHGSNDDQATYLALKYFALACDQEALGILNRHYFKYQTSSMEWATIVRSFGECKYTAAVPHLVETVSAMMLDLGYAAHLSLRAIYPEAKIEFDDPSKTREAWGKYVAHRR